MGRVYDALKRAAETNGADEHKSENGEASAESVLTSSLVDVAATGTQGAAGTNGNGKSSSASNAAVTTRRNGNSTHAKASTEHLLRSSQFFSAPETPVQTSAPNAHTEHLVGSALSGGQASRVAGATLGAAGGSTRGLEFVSIEVPVARVEPHLVAITDPRSSHAERYRSLRTRVLHAGERKKLQTFVITSAGVMEGKTLTSINLSWLLAQTDGVRALLIDGDLRQPCVANYLGLDKVSGLSEVLAGEASLEESIVRLEPAGLYLLPGGAARDDVAEIFSGPKFKELLAQARRDFDYIIIDAPPLGIFTDAAVLINRADSALIVARAGKTRYAALERLLAPLPRERLLGIVLNGAEEVKSEHDYYYKRRYLRSDTEPVKGEQ